MPGLSRNWAADFLDHRSACAADRGHAEGAEQVRKQCAQQQAYDHVRVGQGEIDIRVRDAEIAGIEAKIGRVGREQNQRTEARRTDRIALGHRLGRVSDRVERVRAVAHVVLEPRHFGDPAGIVGYRAMASRATMPASASMAVAANAMPIRPAS